MEKKKKPRSLFLWTLLALALSIGLYNGIKWGLKPKPIPRLNPTKFENFEQIGAVVYRGLRPALRQEKMVVLGSAPWLREYERIWNGFIGAAREDKWQVNVLFEDASLRAIKEFSGLERKSLSWPDPDPALKDELTQNLKFGRLVIVHTTFNHSSHRSDNSLSKELETLLHRPWTSITMLSFGTSADEIEHLQPPCEDELAPANRGEYVACAAVKISRRYLRKHLDRQRIWAAMEQHGLKDYFLYVHEAQSTSLPQ